MHVQPTTIAPKQQTIGADLRTSLPRNDFDVPWRIGTDPEEFRGALLRYWRQMTGVSLGTRLNSVAGLRVRDAEDRSAHRAIALAAIADHQDSIVYTATKRYLAHRNLTQSITDYRVVDALAWVARQLALKPAAVFAALLTFRDEAINSRLIRHRSSISCASVVAVLAEMRAGADEFTRQFLEDWEDLEAWNQQPMGDRTPTSSGDAAASSYG